MTKADTAKMNVKAASKVNLKQVEVDNPQALKTEAVTPGKTEEQAGLDAFKALFFEKCGIKAV